jgi:hypothetical protein
MGKWTNLQMRKSTNGQIEKSTNRQTANQQIGGRRGVNRQSLSQ